VELLLKIATVSLLILSLSLNAITFKSQLLKDNNSELDYYDNNFGSFEKVVADFNGDGKDDVLSLGGGQELLFDSISVGGAIRVSETLLMHLSDGNKLSYHDIGFQELSPIIVIVDIDADGDLDILLQNCKIALNDGNANFTLTEFDSLCHIPKQFYAVDIDGDNDVDIITHENIYKNDGNLSYTKTQNSISLSAELFSMVDVNKDNKADMLVVVNNELQSWINDGLGGFEFLERVDLPSNAFIIHSMPNTTENSQDIMLGFHGDINDSLKLMTNDGNGRYESADFELALLGIQSEELKIGKLYNKDADNDGIDDLWVSAVYRNYTHCGSNNQNLLFLYKQSDESWQQNALLHSEGLVKNNLLHNRVTVDSLPIIIDLNGDNLPEAILSGQYKQTWIASINAFDGVSSFHLSKDSLESFSQAIDAVDYDSDGDADIFNAINFSGFCESQIYQENFFTASQYVHSILWENNGEGQFEAFISLIGGGNDFLQAYEYAIFADLEGNDEQNLIVTIPARGDSPRISRYIYPRQVDPGLSYDLPEVTLNAQTAQLDSSSNKSQIVMIADISEAPIIVSQLGSEGLIEVARLDFGVRKGEFKLADMDGDGAIDIIASNRADNNSIKIWYNDGNLNFIEASLPIKGAISLAAIDINGDGKLDVMAGNFLHDVWVNQGQRNYVLHEYDDKFWYFINDQNEQINKVPSNMQVVDWNEDGKEDLLVEINSSAVVYINQSNSNGISFYQNYSVASKGRAKVVDISGNGKLDVVTNYDKLYQTSSMDFSVPTGLYFDNSHNGHGFSIDEIGYNNLYYSIFYTYNAEGSPEWFSTLSHFTGNGNGYFLTQSGHPRKVKHSYDYSSQRAIINENFDELGRISFSQGHTPTTALRRATFGIYGQTTYPYYQGWNIQEIIPFSQRPQNDFSGHWWAGENDSGWGISLNFKEDDGIQTVVATLYFYDEEGQPVWVIGTQEGFELNQDITINMDKVNGYGRLQNSVELTRVPAGAITINLNQASQDINQAGRLTMDVHYPDDAQNNNWVRSSIPFGLLSKPR
jgi:hypothetical protein